ncbi:MAG: PHP domain-containing protein, partial [Selenomonas sp.]|nr:PHP domain-containing protein [Selenomonas sp.]
IEFVRRKGIDISLEKVQEFTYMGILDRYAVMRYLVSLHLYDRAQPLWDNYLDPAVVELGLNYNITAEEALPIIHEAGGVTSLAHFHKKIGLANLDSRQQQEQAIVELHRLGLDGMERFYPNYSAEDAEFAAQMIKKYDLLPTGGTDFHGTNRPGIEMGSGMNGNMAVPYEFFQEVKSRLTK